MSIDVGNLPELIRNKKQEVRKTIGNIETVLATIEAEMRTEVDEIAGRRTRGEAVIPEIDYAQIRAGEVSDTTKAEIRRRGTVVVRNVFSRTQAEGWNKTIGQYLAH